MEGLVLQQVKDLDSVKARKAKDHSLDKEDYFGEYRFEEYSPDYVSVAYMQKDQLVAVILHDGLSYPTFVADVSDLNGAVHKLKAFTDKQCFYQKEKMIAYGWQSHD